MDFELRTVLLIVGIIVIAAILLHGLLNIRQSNQPVDISEFELDKSDFNEDMNNSISSRISSNRSTSDVQKLSENQSMSDSQSVPDNKNASDAIKRHEALKVDETEEEQLPLNLDDMQEKPSAPIYFDIALDETTDDENADKNSAPMFSSPISQEKEDFLTASPSLGDVEKAESTDDEATESDANVEEVLDTAIENTQEVKPKKEQPPEQEVMDVLVLNVVGDDDVELDGARLLPTLLTLGFKFGDMNIFHRHVDAAGQGPVLFSLANMVKPGYFDIDNMEQFSTTGVSLFMTLPHKSGNMETFNIMLNAAAKIAEEFEGQVLNDTRSTLTKQSTQQYVQRIREVERQLVAK